MPRRSESPEGVGDLLKLDSFGGFEDDDAMLEGGADGDTEAALEIEAAQEAASKDNQSTSNGPSVQAKTFGGANGATLGRGRGQLTTAGPGVKPLQQQQQTFKGRGPARYFIIKSNNLSNIEHSVKNGVWATQKHNEDKLVDAFRTASHVYLVFSANMSGHFQGYAKMSGLPFRHQQGAWEGSAAVSNSFNVDWIRRYDLPFKETEHLTNPLNENKPVKISRDGQELPLALGLQLCRMFDEGADAAGVPKPPPPIRNPGMRAGPPIGGMGGGRGVGRGGMGGPPGPRAPGGMVMTPMGMMPAHMAMGMNGGPMMGGMGFGGMEEMGPMMAGPMGMGMGMHPMMMGGMMGMGPGMGPGMARGPVPPPKPPPRSPPRSRPLSDEGFGGMLMNGGMRGSRGYSDLPRSREEELMLRAFEMTQRGRSPRRERRHRTRSRSASPRRGRSRRHSGSRSRSRSRGRGRDRDDLLEMSYDDYLEAFKALTKAKMEKEMHAEREPSRTSRIGGDSMPAGGMNPMMAQMAGMMAPDAGRTMPGGMSSGGMPNMMAQMGSMMRGQAPGSGSMSEDDYVRVWENYSKMTGRPFDAQTVRGWYRQYKQFNMMSK